MGFLCFRVDQHAEGMPSFFNDLLVGPCRARRFGSCPLGNRRAIAWRRGVFLSWRADQHAEGMTSFFNDRPFGRPLQSKTIWLLPARQSAGYRVEARCLSVLSR